MAVKDGAMRNKFSEERQVAQDRKAGTGNGTASDAAARPKPDGASRVKHGLY